LLKKLNRGCNIFVTITAVLFTFLFYVFFIFNTLWMVSWFICARWKE